MKFIARLLVWLSVFVCALWAFGALHYDFPIHGFGQWASLLFLVILLAAVIFIPGSTRKFVAVFLIFVVVLCWWLTLKPSGNGAWQPDVAETAWAEVNGDDITVHNVRNCDYRTETNYTARWETRTVRASHITGVDLAIDYWGSPLIAHPIASFQFADALPLCFSIETRKKIGQTYSTIGGLYRQFELVFIVADERDVIRVRTNYRKGEDIYLYRTALSPEKARQRFFEYINSVNKLHEHPRWYNAITTNCTTSIRDQHPESDRIPWDWRILVNGKGDEMMYERHLIRTGGLSFAELKQRSLVTERARAANEDPDFSRLIRAGLPQSD